MQEVFDYLRGKISNQEFESLCESKPEIWQWLQSLVPEDIRSPDCEFRKRYPVKAEKLEDNLYRVEYAAMVFGTDYSFIRDLVLFSFPETECCDPLKLFFQPDPLEKMGLEYIDGPEVEQYIQGILEAESASTWKVKKQRLREAFHLVPRKAPRWMQEPDWPAIDGRPMVFASQSHDGDRYTYIFTDENGQNERVIEQYG